MEKLLLTPAEVCKVLSIGRSRVYEMINQKEIPSVRIGRRIRIPRRPLEAWIREKQIGGPIIEPDDSQSDRRERTTRDRPVSCQQNLCEAFCKMAEVISKNS